MRKQPGKLPGTTALEKIFSININWRSYPQRVRLLIGPRIHKNYTCISMRTGCMSCYFQANSHRQKTSEDTAAICCFLVFDSNLQTKYRKKTYKPSQAVSIKYRPLSLQMKPINRKFRGLMKTLMTP